MDVLVLDSGYSGDEANTCIRYDEETTAVSNDEDKDDNDEASESMMDVSISDLKYCENEAGNNGDDDVDDDDNDSDNNKGAVAAVNGDKDVDSDEFS